MATLINTADITDPSLLPSQDIKDWVYNGLDCCVTLEVLENIENLLDDVSRVTYNLSLSLQAPILEMSMRGIRIDLFQREQVKKEYIRQLELIEAQLSKILFEGLSISLNWRSPAQLKKLFYEVLQLPEVKKRNAHGKMAATTNRDALEKLYDYHYATALCNRLLVLRDIEKKRQFLSAKLDEDNHIRANFNIAGTNTGRLASSVSDYGTGTNLQNVDRLLRTVFIPDKGMKFANIDLEQADARNVGAICWNLFVETHGEAYAGAYLDACESGDLHTTVCSMAYNELPWTTDPKKNREIADAKAYRELSYRDLSKKLGHGTNYYGQPPTMAKHTRVRVDTITTFQHKYFGGFPAIGCPLTEPDAAMRPNWHNWVKRQLRESQCIITQYGRRRWFFDDPKNQETIRAAIAFEPQSMTADEINRAILNIWRANVVQILCQVHDSLLVQYPEEMEDEIIPKLKQLFRAPLTLRRGREFLVPCEVKVGWNWGDMIVQKDGTVINPFGLMKYKGTDTRKPPRDLFDGKGI